MLFAKADESLIAHSEGEGTDRGRTDRSDRQQEKIVKKPCNYLTKFSY